jgi:hypothetical protein
MGCCHMECLKLEILPHHAVLVTAWQNETNRPHIILCACRTLGRNAAALFDEVRIYSRKSFQEFPQAD